MNKSRPWPTGTGVISQIDPEKPETWRRRIFLTLDLDWASDEVLSVAIDLVEAAGVRATWFVTHDTKMLERLRSAPQFELGIHPNFNNLLFHQDPSNGATPRDVASRLMDLVPEAVAVRSHSLTQSSRLAEVFRETGLKYECNDFIPATSGVVLAPWKHWNGMTRVPFCWEDHAHNLAGSSISMADLVARDGLTVCSFHPIHLFLNTDSVERYEAARGHLTDFGALGRHVNTRRPGTRDRFATLVKACRLGLAESYSSRLIRS